LPPQRSHNGFMSIYLSVSQAPQAMTKGDSHLNENHAQMQALQ